MGTLIRMKAEVVNPELPVITEQGILPYYTGVYVNRLAEKGVTLTQTEINAITAFINSLIDADLIDKIGTFYPFIGNVNVPLLGNRELEFADVTSANTKLDFVENKLRGIKAFDRMDNVKLSDLANSDFGVMFGGSAILATPTTMPSSPNLTMISIRDKQYNTNIPSIQYRMSGIVASPNDYKFVLCDYYDPNDDSNNVTFRMNPAIEKSNDQHNFSFTHGFTNVAPPYSTGFKEYNRTVNRDGINIANTAAADTTSYIHSENIGDFTINNTSINTGYDAVITTLSFFNEIVTKEVSKAFVDALDTFTAAVGKTVAVG